MILSPPPKLQFFDINGNYMVGGKLYTYLAGTTTPHTTYQDKDGNIANTNPVVLDSRGEANVWLDTTVLTKFILTDVNNVEIWSVDNIGAVITTGVVDSNLRVNGAITASGDITAFAGVAPLTGVPNMLPTYDVLVALVDDLKTRIEALEAP